MRHWTNGLLVPLDRPQELAAALAAAISDQPRRPAPPPATGS